MGPAASTRWFGFWRHLAHARLSVDGVVSGAGEEESHLPNDQQEMPAMSARRGRQRGGAFLLRLPTARC